jgi:tetratricopeptide (TPR) repeat protein
MRDPAARRRWHGKIVALAGRMQAMIESTTLHFGLGRGIALLLCGVLAAQAQAMDIDALWDYADPAASEQRFRAALDTASPEQQLELQTQIARTLSLRRRFDAAHLLLDTVQPRASTTPTVQVRYLLERGRSFNSAGQRETARSLFEQAFAQAQLARLDALAVDAAHMVAISHAGSAAALDWNRRGIQLARASSDAQARRLLPAMLNNSAWDLHDMGRPAEALVLFEQALAEWTARGRPQQVRVAEWSVARCLRSLGRHDEALARQLALLAEHRRAGSSDGFVNEEIAENLLALGSAKEAQAQFAVAAQLLAQEEGFSKAEPQRLARLRRLGGLD